MQAAEPKIGAILAGRYQLLSELGRGGMGAVFLALDFQTGREVAIKMGLSGLDEAGRARLRREALALAQIEHPGVVPVHDARLEGDWPFFVMPRLSGEDFQSWIDREGRCEDPEALDTALTRLSEVAEALAFCHERGLSHRDLKPRNIMILAEDEPRAVVLDFGLVASVSGNLASGFTEALTRTQESLGTPHYMAPEQLDKSLGEVGPASDVWALGACLYAAITGFAPNSGSSSAALVAQRVASPPPRLEREAPWAPRWLARLCQEAMAVRIENRPSMAALSQALRDRKPLAKRPVSTLLLLSGVSSLLLALALALTILLSGTPLLQAARPPALVRESLLVLELTQRGGLFCELFAASGREGERRAVALRALGAGRWQIDWALEEGANEILVQAKDALGRQSEVWSAQVLCDSRPPEASFKAPGDELWEPELVLSVQPSERCHAELRLLSQEGESLQGSWELKSQEACELRAWLPQGKSRWRLELSDEAGNRTREDFEASRIRTVYVVLPGQDHTLSRLARRDLSEGATRFLSIQEAIDALQESRLICLAAGEYLNPISLGHGPLLEIRGPEKGEVARLKGGGQAVLSLRDAKLRVRNLEIASDEAIRNPRDRDSWACAVMLMNSQLEMTQCKIDTVNQGVLVLSRFTEASEKSKAGGSRLTARQVQIRGEKACRGIFVGSYCEADLEGLLIRDFEFGAEIQTGSGRWRAVMIENSLEAVRIHDRGKLIWESGGLRGAIREGVILSDTSEAELKNLSFRSLGTNKKQHRIGINASGGRLKASTIEITGFLRAGVHIEGSETKVTLSDCEFCKDVEDGIYARGGGELTMIRCRFGRPGGTIDVAGVRMSIDDPTIEELRRLDGDKWGNLFKKKN